MLCHGARQAIFKQEIREPMIVPGSLNSFIENFFTFSFAVQVVFWAYDQPVLSAASQHSDQQSR